MKKIYLKPEMAIMKIDIKNSILEGSYIELDNDQSFGRDGLAGKGNNILWEFDEDEEY